MHGTKAYHTECCNPIRREHTWHKLTDKWKLGIERGIPMIQSKDHMKIKRKEEVEDDRDMGGREE